MLFVLTDGNPDNATRVINAVNIAKSFGVTIIPIGISTSYVAGFTKDEFVVVNDPAELTTALRQAVKLKLFS